MKPFDFVRIAVVAPELKLADPGTNCLALAGAARQAAGRDADLAVFPELSLTGYSCGDLFHQERLLRDAGEALAEFALRTRALEMTSVVGLPLRHEGRLFNVAAVVRGGKVIGASPKFHLPNHQEYYEARWFASGRLAARGTARAAGLTFPFGNGLLFAFPGEPELRMGIEICEDLWGPQPPSGEMAAAGALLIANPSASVELLGKAAYRRALIAQQSARCAASYAYAASGPEESSADVVFSGHCLIAENGNILAESERFSFETAMSIADVDTGLLRAERLKNSAWTMGVPAHWETLSMPEGSRARPKTTKLLRRVEPHPFAPADTALRCARCRDVFAIQSTGLARRLRHTGLRRVVIGVSGGLDSTLALLVCAKAFDRLGLSRKGIIAVTMPGFGTTKRTHSNALALMRALGVTAREISIREAVETHFRDIGHDPRKHDVTYENAQARERTQILMDLANKHAALVVGTGDLSEAALGWCTFNGDHMSMYHVNIGVPKTLVRFVIEWCADAEFEHSEILRDIVRTPITPELLPVDGKGKSKQRTEDTIGPYELHDFFLYWFARHGFDPEKILWLARQAFDRSYSAAATRKWMRVFLRRFFASQFKRNAMPDGPKVGTVALSPRGDWRMPSDACAKAWLDGN